MATLAYLISFKRPIVNTLYNCVNCILILNLINWIKTHNLYEIYGKKSKNK